ncbi:MAG: RluA family pseudouridine synthase [Myxococcota bacterium]
MDGVDGGVDRLDRWLLAHLPDVSRSELQRWMQSGRVLVDGRPARPKDRPKAGARIEVWPADPPPSSAEPEDLPLQILHLDPHVLVVNKAPGMVVHPAPGHPRGTLVNAVLHHAPVEDPAGDRLRPGIVHRLDKDTSGVLVVARTPLAKKALVALFSEHRIERRYRAIALGEVSRAVTIDLPIGRHPRDRKRFSTKSTRGKRAVTHVVPRGKLHGATEIECQLETGRTHQIRVHLSETGHPLLGDPVYGRRSSDRRILAAASGLGRQALHAEVLGFPHPATGKALRFEAPPPDDFAAAQEALRDPTT